MANLMEDIKVIQMITASELVGTSAASALTTGSGGAATCGIVDTKGYDYALVIFSFGTISSATRIRLVHQSGAAATVSGGAASGLTEFETAFDISGIAKGSSVMYAAHIDLRQRGGIKRYLNAKVSADAGNSAHCDVLCILSKRNGNVPGTSNFTTTRYIDASA